jgi:hypothetical protein
LKLHFGSKRSKGRSLGERAEGGAEGGGVGVGDLFVEFVVSLAPDGEGLGEEVAAFGGELEEAAAAVFAVEGDFDEATALEGLEGGGEGGAIHGEEVGDGRHGWGFGAVEGDE